VCVYTQSRKNCPRHEVPRGATQSGKSIIDHRISPAAWASTSNIDISATNDYQALLVYNINKRKGRGRNNAHPVIFLAAHWLRFARAIDTTLGTIRRPKFVRIPNLLSDIGHSEVRVQRVKKFGVLFIFRLPQHFSKIGRYDGLEGGQ